MAVFWRQGYEATSIDDLVVASGLKRGSMYAAFGDKRGLFLAVLDHYLARVNARRAALLTGSEPALARLHAFFDTLTGDDAEAGLGCLITNTLTEVAPVDATVAEKLRVSLQRIEDLFEQTVRDGQAEGTIDPARDPRSLARLLLAAAQGMRVLGRSGASRAMLRDIAGQAVEGLARAA